MLNVRHYGACIKNKTDRLVTHKPQGQDCVRLVAGHVVGRRFGRCLHPLWNAARKIRTVQLIAKPNDPRYPHWIEHSANWRRIHDCHRHPNNLRSR